MDLSRPFKRYVAKTRNCSLGLNIISSVNKFSTNIYCDKIQVAKKYMIA